MRKYIELGLSIIGIGACIYNYLECRRIDKKAERTFEIQEAINDVICEDIRLNRDEIITIYEHLDHLCEE